MTHFDLENDEQIVCYNVDDSWKEPIHRQEYSLANVKNYQIEKDAQAKSNTIFTFHLNSELDVPRVFCLN